MFSKTCEHAIKATVFVTRQTLKRQRASLKDIASGIDSPEAYTAKILQMLAKNGFVFSIKGAGGGFEADLNKMSQLPLLRVVEAFDGDFITSRCVLGLKSCSSSNPCPFHHKYAPVRGQLIGVLESTSIMDLALGLLEGNTRLKEI